MSNRWMVISLARTGTWEFVREMVLSWPDSPPQVWLSAHAPVVHYPNSQRIASWRTNLFAPIATLLFLPLFLWRLRKYLIKHPYVSILFPSFHLWHGPAAWLARKFSIPVFMIVHDAIPHPGEHKMGLIWLENKIYRQANGLIFLSNYAHGQFCKYRFRPAYSKVLYHGPLTLSAENPDHTIANQAEGFRILFFGRLVYYKGIDLLIEALRLLPADHKWMCQIFGEQRGRIELPDFHDLPVVLHEGRMDEKEVASLFQTHDLLVLPYREASQSGVLMLAAAAGLPVVCTRVGGLQEQLGEDAVYWVEPNAASIREGIFHMMTNAPLLEKKRAAIIESGKAMEWGAFFKGLAHFKSQTTNYTN